MKNFNSLVIILFGLATIFAGFAIAIYGKYVTPKYGFQFSVGENKEIIGFFLILAGISFCFSQREIIVKLYRKIKYILTFDK